jgi:acetyltransferase-like isoleucine patch superfamily enzyme
MLLTGGMVLGTLILYALEIVVLGLAMFPGALWCQAIWTSTTALFLWQRILVMCFAVVAAYFLYGFTLMAIVGILRIALRLKLREGAYPIVSVGAAKWALASALKSPVAITFMNFILMTPFAAIFYRLMGAKIGRNVHINSKSCADPSLLEIGENSVIGGHATVIGHAFEQGKLILKKVKIGKDVVVGLNAVLLPGVEAGDGATIAAGAVVPKNTKIAAGSTYMGIPIVP